MIVDNLSSHKSARAQACLKRQDNWLLFRCSGEAVHRTPFFPSTLCSPNLNQIEMAFAKPKLKAHLRRFKARNFDALLQPVAKTHDIFKTDECRNVFRAA